MLLPLPLIEQRWIEQQRRQGLTGEKGPGNGLVFCDNQGQVVKPTDLLRDFRSVLNQAQLPPLCFHDLRSTTTFLMLATLNIPPEVVQVILGHSAMSTALSRLSPIFPSQIEEALRKLYDLLMQEE